MASKHLSKTPSNGGQDSGGELPEQQVLPGIAESADESGRVTPPTNTAQPLAVPAPEPPKTSSRGAGSDGRGVTLTGDEGGSATLPEPAVTTAPHPVQPLKSSLFDVNRLKLSQSYAPAAMVKPILTRIDCRKPHDQEFVRVHPDYVMDMMFLKDKADKDKLYVIDPSMAEALAAHAKPLRVRLAVNAQKIATLWAIALPGPDGKSNPWWDTAHQAAAMAVDQWIKVVASHAHGYYQISPATADLGQPEWPDKTFEELLAMCFEKYVITYHGHPVAQRLLLGR